MVLKMLLWRRVMDINNHICSLSQCKRTLSLLLLLLDCRAILHKTRIILQFRPKSWPPPFENGERFKTVNLNNYKIALDAKHIIGLDATIDVDCVWRVVAVVVHMLGCYALFSYYKFWCHTDEKGCCILVWQLKKELKYMHDGIKMVALIAGHAHFLFCNLYNDIIWRCAKRRVLKYNWIWSKYSTAIHSNISWNGHSTTWFATKGILLK